MLIAAKQDYVHIFKSLFFLYTSIIIDIDSFSVARLYRTTNKTSTCLKARS